MTLKSDEKFKEKLAFDFKHEMRNLVNFHLTTQKPENFTLMDSFFSKVYMTWNVLKWIANKTKATIFGTTESKLDHTIPKFKDRNRNGGGVACYIKKDLCFNTRALNCKENEKFVFDILL